MAVQQPQKKKPAPAPASAAPAPTSGGGSKGTYGEGAVNDYFNQLQALKQQVLSGQMTLTDYQGAAEPLVKKAASLTYQLASSGSKQASAVVPLWNQILQNGYAAGDTLNTKVALPFSKQEYAKLPDNVLPTQDDINKGLFDSLTAPLQRVRPTGPAAQPNPGPGGINTTPGVTTPNTQTGNAPVFTANPNNPAPYGGLESNNQAANIDAQKIAQEAALQQQLAVQASEGRSAQRKKYLDDLSGILMQQQNQAFSEQNPIIQEELNSKGLLRSSELGNALGRELKSLQGVTSSQLAKYGVEGQTADLNDLKGIQDSYNQGRNSALQRQFSMEDYQRQIQAGKEMGEQYAKLTPNQGKSGSPTTGALITAGGTLGGAALGSPALGKAGGSVAASATQGQ